MFYHGEIVGVGLLLQLRLEEMKNNNKLAEQSIKQLLELMKKLNLPTTIAQLGINVFENQNLDKIAEFILEINLRFTSYPLKFMHDIVEIIANFEKQNSNIIVYWLKPTLSNQVI